MDRDTEKKKLDAGKEREQVARGVEQATAHPALLPPNLNSLNQKMNKLAEFRNTIQRQIDHADKVHARIERRRIALRVQYELDRRNNQLPSNNDAKPK